MRLPARAFYSGHYQCPGLDIQAVCDSKCRFIYFSVAAVGSTPDCSAFAKTDLPELLGNLPYPYYIPGDCAYICTNKLLIPYAGSHHDDSAKDSFNFHLSQLRIKIEQAFGMMVNKWRVLKRPLELSLEHTSALLLAISRIHNYCINENVELDVDKELRSAEPVISRRNPVTQRTDSLYYLPSMPPNYRTVQRGDSAYSGMWRDMVRNYVATTLGLTRPEENLRRNSSNSLR